MQIKRDIAKCIFMQIYRVPFSHYPLGIRLINCQIFTLSSVFDRDNTIIKIVT